MDDSPHLCFGSFSCSSVMQSLAFTHLICLQDWLIRGPQGKVASVFQADMGFANNSFMVGFPPFLLEAISIAQTAKLSWSELRSITALDYRSQYPQPVWFCLFMTETQWAEFLLNETGASPVRHLLTSDFYLGLWVAKAGILYCGFFGVVFKERQQHHWAIVLVWRPSFSRVLLSMPFIFWQAPPPPQYKGAFKKRRKKRLEEMI